MFNHSTPICQCSVVKPYFFKLICVTVLISSKDMPPPLRLVVTPPFFALCIYLAEHDLFFFLCVCSHWIQTTLTLTLNAMFSATSSHLPDHLCYLLLKCVLHKVIPFAAFDYVDVGWQNSRLRPESYEYFDILGNALLLAEKINTTLMFEE